MTMQLLGKADPSTDDAETVAQRWKLYIESYVLTHPTEGVRREPKNPFLRRYVLELTRQFGSDGNIIETSLMHRSLRLGVTPRTGWRFASAFVLIVSSSSPIPRITSGDLATARESKPWNSFLESRRRRRRDLICG